jgi:hypothetical protein
MGTILLYLLLPSIAKLKANDVSEEHITSIFKAGNTPSKKLAPNLD